MLKRGIFKSILDLISIVKHWRMWLLCFPWSPVRHQGLFYNFLADFTKVSQHVAPMLHTLPKNSLAFRILKCKQVFICCNHWRGNDSRKLFNPLYECELVLRLPSNSTVVVLIHMDVGGSCQSRSHFWELLKSRSHFWEYCITVLGERGWINYSQRNFGLYLYLKIRHFLSVVYAFEAIFNTARQRQPSTNGVCFMSFFCTPSKFTAK